ncbi:sigma 54-interacting transcriptional regulator [Profundibacter sp.]|uniref:sigma 54-interacting transcriptional regulator n=1 Tax=Profundibacter sp. TaxID=3101071 RepID=UPI003D0F2F4B
MLIDNLVGESPEMAEVRRLVSIFAAADTPVLICGESGVGKGSIAASLHAQSTRANGRFITVDCDDSLNESDLFGQDANGKERCEGLIAAADGGTIFLNDIDKLSDAMQSKLLRVIETGTYRPLMAWMAPASVNSLWQSEGRRSASQGEDHEQETTSRGYRHRRPRHCQECFSGARH